MTLRRFGTSKGSTPFGSMNKVGSVISRLSVALGLLVLRRDGFVGEQETALLQVAVEFAGQMLGGGNVPSMLAEDPAHGAAEQSLAGPLAADENEGDFGLPVRVLHSVGQPVDGCIRKRRGRPPPAL